MAGPRVRTFMLLVFVLFVLLAPLVEAAVPRQIAISGLRTNTTGGSEKNFFHSNVNFTIFDSQSGGRILDTRQINVSTNTNGYWFINYSTSGFDTEVDLWLAINNTAPRLFLGPEPYSSQYLRRNESNSVNSSLTLVSVAALRGFQSTSLVNSTHINASALGYAAIPVAATGVNLFSNLLSASNTFSGNNIFSGANTFSGLFTSFVGVNVTNLTHTSAGLLINTTGGINASAVGFGTIPAGVLGNAATLAATNVFTGLLNSFVGLNTTNLTHPVGGLLINTTGGINASAAGFGSIPQGVLDSARNWTGLQIFTAGVRSSGLNVSGDVNISAAAETDHVLAIYDASGAGVFRVNLVTAAIDTIYSFNITSTGLALTIRNGARDIFRVIATTGGTVDVLGTLNVTNMTHRSAGLLINDTGNINASAVRFGLLGDVIPIYANQSVPGYGSFTPSGPARIQFGYTEIIFGASGPPSDHILVNLSRGYSCASCYVAIVRDMNDTSQNVNYLVLNKNGSQFNISSILGPTNRVHNLTWMTIGY